MKSILFVELLGGLGDLVMALPAIHALALSHPQARLTVVTFAPGAELLEADPLVWTVRRVERGDAADPERPRRALAALLAEEHFDLVVSDATYDAIDRLLEGAAPRAVTNLWRQPPADQRVEERFLQILAQEGLIMPWTAGTRPRLTLTAADRRWAARHLPGPARRALLHPHAGMPIKTWPLERFVAVGHALQDEMGLQVVVPEGREAEAETARELVRALGPQAILLPQGSLRQFAAAAQRSELAVGGDTGPLRLAAAAGTPVVTLLGPTWHGRYGQPPPHINLQGCPECTWRQAADFTRQPCWYSGACPLGWWRSCLEDIGVSQVLEAIRRLLHTSPAPRAAGRDGRR